MDIPDPVPPDPEPTVPDTLKARERERPDDDQQADRKYHIDKTDYKDVPTLDANGNLKGLSQLDDCWLSDNSVLTGDASVTKDAQMEGHSVLYGDAVLTENAAMGGNAKACGSTRIDGQAVVTDDVLLKDAVRAGGSVEITDGKDADGNWVPSLVGGSSRLSDGVRIAGGAVLGNTELSDEVRIGPGVIVSGAEGDGVRLGGKLELSGTVTATGMQSRPRSHPRPSRTTRRSTLWPTYAPTSAAGTGSRSWNGPVVRTGT